MINNNSIYLKLYEYIPFSLKKRVYILIPFLGFSGLAEVLSLAALIPLISFILEPSSKDIFILNFFNFDQFTNYQKVIFLFSIYILVIIVKSFFVFLTYKYTFETSVKIKAYFQQKLFSIYLYRDFTKHLSANIANYIRNITLECNQLEGRLLMPFMTLIAELLPIFFIISFLFYINPYGLLIAFLIFSILNTKYLL